MTQRQYRGLFTQELDRRQTELEQYIRRAFASHISSREESFVDLSSMATDELARLISDKPSSMIRILFRITGASPRSVARDLRIRVVSEPEGVSSEVASRLASYFRELLPKQLAISTILFHDRIQRENELVRAYKGRWEYYVRDLLGRANLKFTKRRFRVDRKTIEIDGAYPSKGDPTVAIDVKRIEALEDYQKRTDEINAKARELKAGYKVVFIACIFFPFAEKREMVLNRLDRTMVDRVYFQDEILNMLADINKIVASARPGYGLDT